MANICEVFIQTQSLTVVPVELIWHPNGSTAEVTVAGVTVAKDNPARVSQWFYDTLTDIIAKSDATLQDVDKAAAKNFFYMLTEETDFFNEPELSPENQAIADEVRNESDTLAREIAEEVSITDTDFANMRTSYAKANPGTEYVPTLLHCVEMVLEDRRKDAMLSTRRLQRAAAYLDEKMREACNATEYYDTLLERI